jgi:hypothetical protein
MELRKHKILTLQREERNRRSSRSATTSKVDTHCKRHRILTCKSTIHFKGNCVTVKLIRVETCTYLVVGTAVHLRIEQCTISLKVLKICHKNFIDDRHHLFIANKDKVITLRIVCFLYHLIHDSMECIDGNLRSYVLRAVTFDLRNKALADRNFTACISCGNCSFTQLMLINIFLYCSDYIFNTYT